MHRLLLLCTILLCYSNMASAQAEAWWGNFADGGSVSSIGLNTTETYDCAMQYHNTTEVLNGATIHGVRFFLMDKTNLSNVKMWLSTTLPRNAAGADIIAVDIPQDALRDYFHDGEMLEVLLPQPYSLKSNIYVGYSFTVNRLESENDSNPIAYTPSSKTRGGFFLHSSSSYANWTDYVNWFGDLTIQLLISNSSVATNSVSLTTLNRGVTVKGLRSTVTQRATNHGLAGVSSIDYSVRVSSGETTTGHYELTSRLSSYNGSFTFPVEVIPPTSSGSYTYSVTIDRVNGLPNEHSQTTATGQLLTIDRSATRCSVMEEFTGTWCGWCPRGMIGMANLERDFGDRFIGIAVHDSDPMAVTTYSAIMPSSFPTANIDRTINCDPYGGTTRSVHYMSKADFEAALSVPSEADLSLVAHWVNEAQTSIGLTAKTTFLFNNPTSNYQLAFVITADGLTGTGGRWNQVNYFSGSNEYPDDDMSPFRDAPDPATGLTYNHVVAAGANVAGGINGSISTPLISGQEQTYNYTIELPTTSIVQHPDRVKAVAILLDSETGKIVNAAQSPVYAYGYDGIYENTASKNKLSSSSTITYDLSGRAIRPNHPGLYIVNKKKTIITQQP